MKRAVPSVVNRQRIFITNAGVCIVVLPPPKNRKRA
jgi:hypothetical protein